MLGAFAEALTLLKKFGLRPLDVYPLLESSGINCPLLMNKRQGVMLIDYGTCF